MNEAEYPSLPLDEAIKYFRQKLDVPTARWADMLHGAHTRAFTVAGATKEGVLSDFRAAIDKAIAQGTTLGDFRKDFDRIVATRGWDYKGNRGWRTRTIYETNLRTAYAAGRYAQMTDPAVKRYQPYWRYRHQDGEAHPRPEHQAWNGLTLKADDPWWKTHHPPNGWGCQCDVEPVTRHELESTGRKGPDRAPKVEMRKAVLNTSAGPHTIEVPKGIDPGWGYHIGEAAFGAQISADAMAAWKARGAETFERLTPGDWQSAGRPEQIPVDQPKAKPGEAGASEDELRARIQAAIGGAEQAFKLPDGEPLLVDAAALAAHMPVNRAAFVPFLPELIRDPYEIWLSFEQHKGTGKVVLRKRVIKMIENRARGGIVLVAQSSGGILEAWTLVPATRPGYLQRQRVGKLLWARKE